MDLRDNSIIIFTHIMKTAGRSLNELFKTLWGKERVLEVYDRRSTMWEYYQARRKGVLRYIAGHIDFGVHTWLGLTDVTYMVFLRDPLHRAVSEYFYLKDTNPNHPYHAWVTEAGSLEKWLQSERRYRNIQCHRICGRTCEVSHTNATRILQQEYGYFGVQEKMEQSLSRLANWLNVSLPSMPSENQGKYKPLSHVELEHLRPIIEKEDEWDCSLYQMALDSYRKEP